MDLKQKARLRPELSPNFYQLNPQIRPERSGPTYNSALVFPESHASAKLISECWRPDSVKESSIKSSANSRRLILQFPIVAHSSAAFVDPIQVNNKKER